jgi:hypothetical protein
VQKLALANVERAEDALAQAIHAMPLRRAASIA